MLKRVLEESANGRRFFSLVEQAQREYAAHVETRRRTLLNSFGVSSFAELQRKAREAEERAGMMGLVKRYEPPTEMKSIVERFRAHAETILDDRHWSPFPDRREMLEAARRRALEAAAKEMFRPPPELDSVTVKPFKLTVKSFKPFKLTMEIKVVIIPKDKTEGGANPSAAD